MERLCDKRACIRTMAKTLAWQVYPTNSQRSPMLNLAEMRLLWKQNYPVSKMDYHDLINQAYQAFNARHIDGVLALMHPDVQWPNGWEGGYVRGHEEVRTYWLRQWQEIDPEVVPVAIRKKSNGQIEADIHQLIKDRLGNVLADEHIKHLYTLEEGKITRMDIEKP